MRISGSLVRNTGWMFLAQGTRIVFQAGYFVLIARALGAHGFGALAAALALTSALLPFAGWGSGNVLLMQAARDPLTLPVYWGNALVTILVGGTVLTLVTAGLATLIVPGIPLRLVLLLAIADFFFGRIADTAAQAFQGLERMVLTAVLTAVPNGLRFVVAVLFVSFSSQQAPAAWAGWYLLGSAVAALLGICVVTVILGRPRPRIAVAVSRLREGGYFSVNLAAATIYADIDKAMLARMATLDAAGIYAAAYRAINLAFAPVMSLLLAAYARFFRHGANGIRESARFARQLLGFAALYGALASAALYLLAPLLPVVLGQQFHESVAALRWLAPVPFLQAIYYFGADALTGAGHQKVRSLIQVGAAGLNVLLNLWLIPLYSWKGAAWATLASGGALVIGLWSAVILLERRPLRLDAGAQAVGAP